MTGKKLGSDNMVWVESPTPGTYNLILGQGDCTVNRSSSDIDLTTKDDGDYGTGAPGPRKLTLDLNIIPKLPDSTGYTRLETLANASPRAPFNIQIRKNGTSGVSGDAIFAGSVYANLDSTTFPHAGAVGVKCTFTAAAAPTTDVLG